MLPSSFYFMVTVYISTIKHLNVCSLLMCQVPYKKIKPLLPAVEPVMDDYPDEDLELYTEV